MPILIQLSSPSPRRHIRKAMIGAFLLGFAASGFFDGILLHQILQWHHLLSSLKIGILGSLRGQVVFDGVFHAVMYVVGLSGLLMLYKSTPRADLTTISNRLHAMFWAGFGAWHFVDAVVSHWITGIHRVRMDVSNPLVWDLAWPFLFGVVPLVVAWKIFNRATIRVAPGKFLGSFVIAMTVAAGTLNAVPLRAIGNDAITVVLRSDRSLADMMPALDHAGASIVWADPTGAVWALRANEGRLRALDLYRSGALFVSSSLAGAACGSWVETQPG